MLGCSAWARAQEERESGIKEGRESRIKEGHESGIKAVPGMYSRVEAELWRLSRDNRNTLTQKKRTTLSNASKKYVVYKYSY